MRIFIVAGDPSGDLHASNLARKIKELAPQTEIFSAGGKELAGNTTQLIDLEKTAVTGLFEVLTYLKAIIKNFRFVIKKIDELKPDIIILVDFPDFNLRLAEKIKRKNPRIKIIYYISPQVWAWRKKRINLIRKCVDKMLVIFPFEESFYRQYNIPAIYVGHPLLENSPPVYPEQKKEKIIAFFPGSREKEVKKHLTLFVKTKQLLDKEFKFILVKHPGLAYDLFRKAHQAGFEIIEKKDSLNLGRIYLAVASSGTITLELALLQVPTLVVYRMNYLTWLILKNMVKTKFICIVNILAKEKIFPEFIQHQASAENIASYCKKLINNEGGLYSEIQKKLATIRTILGEKPASLIAAKEILTSG